MTVRVGVAMFGAGFIVGPVLGGWLGDIWLRLPFLAAAALNARNLLLALFVLPESCAGARQRIDLAAPSPLRPLRSGLSMKCAAAIRMRTRSHLDCRAIR